MSSPATLDKFRSSAAKPYEPGCSGFSPALSNRDQATKLVKRLGGTT